MSRRSESRSTWRYAIAGDVLTATNRVMSYTLQLGVPYELSEHAARSSKGPLGPRTITQFLDGGARLYTSGAATGRRSKLPPKTLCHVSSFVGTYAVPRTRIEPPPAAQQRVQRPRTPTEHDLNIKSIADSLEQIASALNVIADKLVEGGQS